MSFVNMQGWGQGKGACRLSSCFGAKISSLEHPESGRDHYSYPTPHIYLWALVGHNIPVEIGTNLRELVLSLDLWTPKIKLRWSGLVKQTHLLNRFVGP